MYTVPGPITLRVLQQHGEDSPGWWPSRSAKPATPETAAACGWSLCGRRQTTPAGTPTGTHPSPRPGSRAA